MACSIKEENLFSHIKWKIMNMKYNGSDCRLVAVEQDITR